VPLQAVVLPPRCVAAETIRNQGTIFAPAGLGRVGFVSATDVAAVAAAVLTSDGHEDQTYVLTGPEALAFTDVAPRFSAVFGREVDYDDMPVPLAKDQLLASGLTNWQTEGTLELFDWIRHGGTDVMTSTVRDVTRAEARTIDD